MLHTLGACADKCRTRLNYSVEAALLSFRMPPFPPLLSRTDDLLGPSPAEHGSLFVSVPKQHKTDFSIIFYIFSTVSKSSCETLRKIGIEPLISDRWLLFCGGVN